MLRFTRQQLDAEAQKRAGCVKLQYARSTGTLIGIYKSIEAGIEDDPDCKWTTICETHAAIDDGGSYLISYASRKQAFAWAADPTKWCEYCQEKEKEKTNA